MMNYDHLPSWRCFHCDEVFIDKAEARDHFGLDEHATPACVIKGSEGGLVRALREAEKAAEDSLAAMHAESTDTMRAYQAFRSRHAGSVRAAEEVGYARGLADGRRETAQLAEPALDGNDSLTSQARLTATRTDA